MIKAAESEMLLLSASKAAVLLGISRAHFYTLHSSGRLGPMPVKLGERTLWIREELIDWTAHRCPPREKWEGMKASAG
ncbi:MAG: helix-turn-helix transcriptional regulator [Planctomycetota bacterium]|jgi:predicted DNA-binding transcriptional regulator AlpA